MFPHFGHSIFTVGRVLSFCSFFPIIAMRSWGGCFITFGRVVASGVTGFMYSHFGHERKRIVFFRSFLRTGVNLIPHLGQNSMLNHTQCSLSFIWSLLNLSLDVINAYEP